MFKANVTVLLLVLINNVNISRINRIGRQLQPVELAAGELAVNWQTASAWCRQAGNFITIVPNILDLKSSSEQIFSET